MNPISWLKRYFIYHTTFTAADLGISPEQMAFFRLYGFVEVVRKKKDGTELFRWVDPRRMKGFKVEKKG